MKLNMTDHSQVYTSYNSYPSVMTPTEMDIYLKSLGQPLRWSSRYLQKVNVDHTQNIFLRDIYLEAEYYFELEEVYIRDIHHNTNAPVNDHLVKKYSEMDLNCYPPIIIVFNEILDGHHRVDALKENNQSMIFAYVLKSKLEYSEYV